VAFLVRLLDPNDFFSGAVFLTGIAGEKEPQHLSLYKKGGENEDYTA
jgi:hypothetical protein